eukprot:9379448-Alexandrium_andersonii.AAC.1
MHQTIALPAAQRRPQASSRGGVRAPLCCAEMSKPRAPSLRSNAHGPDAGSVLNISEVGDRDLDR